MAGVQHEYLAAAPIQHFDALDPVAFDMQAHGHRLRDQGDEGARLEAAEMRAGEKAGSRAVEPGPEAAAGARVDSHRRGTRGQASGRQTIDRRALPRPAIEGRPFIVLRAGDTDDPL